MPTRPSLLWPIVLLALSAFACQFLVPTPQDRTPVVPGGTSPGVGSPVVPGGTSPGVGSTAFPPPPSSARIAFTATGWSVPGASEEIFVMNPDGTGITPISNSRGDDRDPAWSPDGKRIAFTSERDGNSEVYIMNADGSGQTRLTNSPENEFYPNWSPDGTKIVFSTSINNANDLHLINVDGSGLTRLTNTPDSSESYPDWSPDGGALIFSSFGGGDAGIFIMDSDGTNVRLLMAGPLHYPKWSADGRYIAFDGEPGGNNFEIYIMKADGSDMRQLTVHPRGPGGYNKCPAWSPDGKQIIYSSSDRDAEKNSENIYVINVDGSGETALTHGVTDINYGGFHSDWSPVP